MKTYSTLTRTALALTVVLAALLLAVAPVLADGIIIPDPPICLDCPQPPPPEPVWLTIKYHHVDVTIQDQVAVTH
ncbi:MAG: hypothetical protein GY832_26630, partial [Chloroflexi bacterium]|nr:hypothetical protein [Chloroflexota bacterium]